MLVDEDENESESNQSMNDDDIENMLREMDGDDDEIHDTNEIAEIGTSKLTHIE